MSPVSWRTSRTDARLTNRVQHSKRPKASLPPAFAKTLRNSKSTAYAIVKNAVTAHLKTAAGAPRDSDQNPGTLIPYESCQSSKTF